MKSELRRLKAPLAMLMATLLLVDAEIIRRLYVHGFPFSWVAYDEAGPAQIRDGHEAALFALLNTVIFGFFFVLHVGIGWLFWQSRRSLESRRSRLLIWMLGGEPVEWTEKNFREFTFKSSINAAIMPWGGAFALILVSVDFVGGWIHLSWERLPYMILVSPIPLLLWATAAKLLLGSRQIQIADGQLRFRRLVRWTSVPLKSISGMQTRWFGIVLTVEYQGKHYWFFFNPEDHKVGPSPPLVIQFLGEVCRRNAEKAVSPA